MRAALRAVALSVVASGALHTSLTNAQTPPAAPPVLSTVPSPQPGVTSEPVQMSGLPLQVGDLPPGIIAVRVIRRTFAEDVADQVVELRAGIGDRLLKAVTNKQGRAQFGPVAVGETVRVRAQVDGEVLESQPFELPAQGGVRLVLVAGVGAGSRSGGAAPPSVAPSAPAAAPSAPVATTVVDRIGAGLIALILLTCAAAAFLWWRQRRPEFAPPRGRAETFEALVRLEKDFGDGRVGQAAYETRRKALVADLVSLDLACGRSRDAAPD